MTCGSCGATIAAKAIVCYRCGTPTAIPEPKRKPSQLAAARRGSAAVVVTLVAAVALLALGVWLVLGAEPGWSTGRLGGYAACAGALILTVILVLARRMRR